jgi:hypothetical protein
MGVTACDATGLGQKIEVSDKPYDPRYRGLTLHDLRRSAARNLLLAGVPETTIMRNRRLENAKCFHSLRCGQHC